MKKTIIILSALAIVIMFTVAGCNNGGSSSSTNTVAPGQISKDSMVKRGEYLVNMMGCDDCHSPKLMGPKGPEIDMARRFSGHPSNVPNPQIDTAVLKSWVLFNQMTTSMVGPWGVSYAANITSDDTGIGTWTEEQFFVAIRQGKSKGLKNARDLLPPMPWPQYRNANDQDLKSIFAYLKSTKPVENVVPAPVSPDRLVAIN